ncbi:unnamed protein product [Diabrotica balteata]|uniref:Uncharacterized protein n=1 Tax=Diabrotica balteata TaxID=107213 RepID=A0A9N9SQF1_DIABA|nr:unnamed protein product [Diabrotica balteata]
MLVICYKSELKRMDLYGILKIRPWRTSLSNRMARNLGAGQDTQRIVKQKMMVMIVFLSFIYMNYDGFSSYWIS